MSEIKQYEPLWDSWQVDSLIDEDSFGKMYEVSREEFGNKYKAAVKFISIPFNESEIEQLVAEGMNNTSIKNHYHGHVQDILKGINLMEQFKGTANIVSFEEFDLIEKKDGVGYDVLIRMEHLENLSKHVFTEPFKLPEILKMGIHICRALELCSLTKIINWDIRPDNIFISQCGDYKLGEFGVARKIEQTPSGLLKICTCTYNSAPEVFKGEECDASVDIYSLGIIMYRFLNQNRTLFLPDFPTVIKPSDRDEALQRRVKGEALPPIAGIDPSLNAVVLKACAYDRRARFSLASEMCEALEAVASGHI